MPRYCDIHTWEPVPLERSVYRCVCTATGYRGPRGKIVAHRKPRTFETPTTVEQLGGKFLVRQPTPDRDSGGSSWANGYRVPALPTDGGARSNDADG